METGTRERERKISFTERERESVPAVDGGEREGNREKKRPVVGLEVVSARDGRCNDYFFFSSVNSVYYIYMND